jgi:hypothetical protein
VPSGEIPTWWWADYAERMICGQVQTARSTRAPTRTRLGHERRAHTPARGAHDRLTVSVDPTTLLFSATAVGRV